MGRSGWRKDFFTIHKNQELVYFVKFLTGVLKQRFWLKMVLKDPRRYNGNTLDFEVIFVDAEYSQNCAKKWSLKMKVHMKKNNQT